MSKPRLAYAGNRRIGMEGLKLFLQVGWKPSVLILPKGKNAEFTEEMKALASDIPSLEGIEFREAKGVQQLKSLSLDYILSVHFPYLIPPEILQIPRIGTLNLHPACLPFNRGWHTPSWAIYDNTPYGATLHWVDEGIDTGNIAMQKEMEISTTDTAHSLYQKVLRLEIELLGEAIPLLASASLPRFPQVSNGTSHRKEDLWVIQRLDLAEEKSVGNILKILRALTTNRWDEAAFFEVDGILYRVRIEIRKEEKDAL